MSKRASQWFRVTVLACAPWAVAPQNTSDRDGSLILWQDDLDKEPLYFSGASVSLSVRQDGDSRYFDWHADWFGILDGRITMGEMVCPMSQQERAAVATVPLQQRRASTIPCHSPDADKLTAGSEIVQLISSSVVCLGAKRIAMVGLGPGTMATYWQRYHPEIDSIDVAELSPTVVDMAHRFFGLHVDRRLRVHAVDGLQWLHGAPPFDVFVHDASGSLHLFLRPTALRAIRAKTGEAGAMVMNLFGVPFCLRVLGIMYLRMYFHEVRVQGDVLVASWTTPTVMRFDGQPEHVRRWLNPDGWRAYGGLCFAHVAFIIVAMAAIAAGVLICGLRLACQRDATKRREHFCLFDGFSCWEWCSPAEEREPLVHPKLRHAP